MGMARFIDRAFELLQRGPDDDETYDFDAGITVMADGRTKDKAADAILEHCLEADIAISLHEAGTLNKRKRK